MKDSINYAKPVTNTSEIVYNSFHQSILKHLDSLHNKTIVIFGAGVRGTLLSTILKELGLNDILFTDNNRSMLGGRINEFPIQDLEDIQKSAKDLFILVSPENSLDIMQQLLNLGFLENINLLNLGTRLYDWFLTEYLDKGPKDIFIVGDCGLINFSLQDTVKDSLGTMIRLAVEEYKVRLLTMNAMGMRAFYNILKQQFKVKHRPKYVFMNIETSVFNGKQHYLPNTQHVDLIRKLYQHSGQDNEELAEYLRVVEERLKSFPTASEATKAYSNDDIGKLMNKTYLKMNYMYKMKLDNEELIYYTKILELFRKNEVEPILFILPINSWQGEQYWGEEFLKAYNENTGVLKQLAWEQGFEVLDLSLLLNSSYFLDTTTVDEAINYEGRLLVCNELISHFNGKQQ